MVWEPRLTCLELLNMSNYPPSPGYPPQQPHGPQQPYGGQHPYAPPQSPYGGGPPRRQGMSGGKIALIVIGIIGALGLLSCGGCVGLYFFGVNAMEEEYADSLAQYPAVRQHLGEIRELDFQLMKSGEHADENAYVFDVVGSKASGTVTIWDDGYDNIVAAKLRLKSGKEIDLVR
jgi:hypothetical protein